MNDETARPLPSERLRPGDTRRVGFQLYPGEEHVERSAAALRDLAERVSSATPTSARPLRIRLCLVRLAPGLPFELFGFHISGVSDDGEFRDDLGDDAEVVYAVVVNQPLDLQRETTIGFLNDLVGRQGPLADIVADRRDIGELPELTDAADAASAELAGDTLRFSLTHAVDALKTRAAGLGYRLEVSFAIDPLPAREDLIRRAPLLRRLYDTESDVRAAVDSTVAMLGGQPPALRGGPEQIRAAIQRQTALLGTRQFMNHALRDAEVCGNGFVEFGQSGLDPALRCLRLEDVEQTDAGFAVGGERVSDDRHVLHLRGVEQFESPYGISPWEPLLFALQRRIMIESVIGRVEEMARRPDAPAEFLQHADAVARVKEGLEADTSKRLERLLWFPRLRLREIREDLYFSGSERYGA
jgi:hypothetical protein